MFDTVEIQEMLRKAAGADLALATDDELCVTAKGMALARRIFDAADAHVLAELDARGVCQHEFGLTTASWLARTASLPLSATKTRVQLASKLRTLPEVDRRLSDGQIGWQHADVIARAANPRIADQISEIQGDLLDLCRGMTYDRWRREVQGIAETLDQDGGYDPDRDRDHDELNLAVGDDGFIQLLGKLSGEDAQVVRAAIETMADSLFHQYQRDAEKNPDLPMPSRSALRAKALVELCRRGLACDASTTRAPVADVTLVMRAGDPLEAARTPDGVRLQDDTIRTLCCDPMIHALVIDDLGVPLDLGRTVRYASDDQRRAASVRDGGCVFPGCDCPPSWCDQHHVQHWEAGGPTDVGNLASLCRRHHGVTHRKGWKMTATDDHWFEWTSPSGDTFASQRHGRVRTQE